MAFTKLTDHIDELGDHIEAYVASMVEYYKLSFFKKLMKGLSSLTKLLIGGSIFLFFLGFISIAFAIWIGASVGSIAAGFFIVGGFYLVVFILLLVFWKKMIEGILLDKFSRFVFDESEREEDLEEMKAVAQKDVIEKELREKEIAEEDNWRTDY